MKTLEKLISPKSDYYIYSPSRMARDMLLYPLQCGIFYYEPGYSLKRDSFDSFLILYLQRGGLELEIGKHTFHAKAGQLALIDCYHSHAYSTANGCDCLWCHFDGITARPFYENIAARLGNVFSLPDTYQVFSRLNAILRSFESGDTVREPLLSRYLNDILTDLLLFSSSRTGVHRYSKIAEETMTYMNEHFAQELDIPLLADRAGLSQAHFIRTFKKETGFTPHEYLLNTRIATAQYLLKNTGLAVKDICYQTGFSSESVFCSSFKTKVGMTPSQYRAQ